MPPGKLSKTKIAKGFEILEEIQEAQKKNTQALNDLASKFYTVFPTHSYRRVIPPVIDTKRLLEEKFDTVGVSEGLYTCSSYKCIICC